MTALVTASVAVGTLALVGVSILLAEYDRHEATRRQEPCGCPLCDAGSTCAKGDAR